MNFIGTMVRRNGNLRIYDVDVKDAGTYSCIVNYLNPETEEEVKNVYKHIIQGIKIEKMKKPKKKKKNSLFFQYKNKRV